MTVLVAVLSIEAIPIGALVGAAFDRSLHRRSRFWLRFAGIVIAVVLPELAAVVAPVGEQTVGVLIWVGLAWGILLLVPSWFVLFRGWGFDPGSANDDDEGPPGPEDGRPTPRSPIGGSHSPTQNSHRPVSPTIARHGGQRTLVGRFASGSVPRYVFGRYGCCRGRVSPKRSSYARGLRLLRTIASVRAAHRTVHDCIGERLSEYRGRLRGLKDFSNGRRFRALLTFLSGSREVFAVE
jgi:hypothetical protein